MTVTVLDNVDLNILPRVSNCKLNPIRRQIIQDGAVRREIYFNMAVRKVASTVNLVLVSLRVYCSRGGSVTVTGTDMTKASVESTH